MGLSENDDFSISNVLVNTRQLSRNIAKRRLISIQINKLNDKINRYKSRVDDIDKLLLNDDSDLDRIHLIEEKRFLKIYITDYMNLIQRLKIEMTSM